MGWLIDNINALDKYQTTADNRERQVREDAYLDEQRQRKRVEQEQKDAADKTTSEEMANQMRDMGTAPVDAREVLGVKPAPVAPDNNPYAAPQSPVAPTASTYADAARKNLTSSMRIAAANKDYTGFQAAYNGFQKLKMNEDSALIASYIQNAPDEELQQVMTKVTLDPQNKYDAVYDPKSGFTTIKLGDTAAQLDRVQLGKYFAAKHRLVQGDYAALNDIGAISGELAKKVADELQLTDKMVDTNNVVNNYQRNLALKGQSQGGGSGGSRGSGGAGELGPIDYSKGVKFNDVYQKNLAFQLDRLKGDPMAARAPITREQADQAAKEAYAMTAQQLGAIEGGSRKSTQESAIHQALGSLFSGRGANPSEYAGRRAQLIDKGFSDAMLTSLGYPKLANSASVIKDGQMISRGTDAR